MYTYSVYGMAEGKMRPLSFTSCHLSRQITFEEWGIYDARAATRLFLPRRHHINKWSRFSRTRSLTSARAEEKTDDESFGTIGEYAFCFVWLSGCMLLHCGQTMSCVSCYRSYFLTLSHFTLSSLLLLPYADTNCCVWRRISGRVTIIFPVFSVLFCILLFLLLFFLAWYSFFFVGVVLLLILHSCLLLVYSRWMSTQGRTSPLILRSDNITIHTEVLPPLFIGYRRSSKVKKNFFGEFSGRVQNLEWSNLKRPMFRNFEIANSKIMKDELVIILLSNLFFLFFKNHSNIQYI